MKENKIYSGMPMKENTIYSGMPMKENKIYSGMPMKENKIYSGGRNSKENTINANNYKKATLESFANNTNLNALNPEQIQNNWDTIGRYENRNNVYPISQPISGNYGYNGCYDTQTSSSAVPNFRKSNVSIDECASTAEYNRERVFALRYNGQCWTGNDIDKANSYAQIYDKDKCKWDSDKTMPMYIRNKEFPPPPPPLPQLSKPNFEAVDPSSISQASVKSLDAQIRAQARAELLQSFVFDGLQFSIYTNNNRFGCWSGCGSPELSIFNNTPINTGKISTIRNTNNINDLYNTYGFKVKDYIAIKFQGYFTPDVSGVWKFLLGDINSRLTNDDLSYLWIGQNALNPTLSNATGYTNYPTNINNAYVSIQLSAGVSYPLLMYWGQLWGGFVVSLGIIPPNGTLTYDGSKYFSTKPMPN
jgi:hypothetical protein